MKRALLLLFVVACDDDAVLTADDELELRAMQLTAADTLPSPTNAVADDDRAAQLGRLVFFDKRMSLDGTVACASCHDPLAGFSDPRQLSLGVELRPGGRHSMPITAVAMQRALFWDGRADSLWSQPLQAIESDKEMDFTRSDVALFIAQNYAVDYQALFGPLPDLSAIPPRAKPGEASWDALSSTQQDAVQRIFANTGKVLEAYQRRITCIDTRFDRWTRGELELTSDERSAAARFVHQGCIDCHAGPAFSDGKFHNIGIGSLTKEPDRGAFSASDQVAMDVFNGAGPYSDDVARGALLLDELAAIPRPLGAFRTPSLRGVTQRKSFGHLGHHKDLDDFINDVYNEPHMQATAVGTLDELVRGIDQRAGGVMPFLRTLECPPLPAWGPPL